MRGWLRTSAAESTEPLVATQAVGVAAREGGGWPRFFAVAQALGQLPRAESDAALRALTPASVMAAQLD